ncbi:MAG: FHA domain-containing protein [Luteitalea sp.]|nr:FHA domain-containing protein [Luteitalea sp.]
MWILETTDGDAPGLTFRISSGIRTMGRAVRADFVIEATMVSRLHCRLTALPTGELEVEDLDSTNGTYVNDQRIQRAVLANGDRLRVGRIELTCSQQASLAPQEGVR